MNYKKRLRTATETQNRPTSNSFGNEIEIKANRNHLTICTI